MRRAASVIRTTLRNRDLRWVVLGYGLFSSTEFAVWIAMLVYAFQQGGTTAAGVVALVQLVPAALFAPIGGLLADRRRPEGVLAGGYVAQAAAMGATAVVLFGGGAPWLAYAFAAAATTAITITRPAQAVLAPGLARTHGGADRLQRRHRLDRERGRAGLPGADGDPAGLRQPRSRVRALRRRACSWPDS